MPSGVVDAARHARIESSIQERNALIRHTALSQGCLRTPKVHPQRDLLEDVPQSCPLTRSTCDCRIRPLAEIAESIASCPPIPS